MATFRNVTPWSSPATATTSFTVTVPAVAAGARLVCVSYGGAVVTASTVNGTLTKRAGTSLGTLEVACADIVAIGGETVVTITLNGANNVSGVIFESTNLGAYVAGNRDTSQGTALDGDQSASVLGVTTTGNSVLFSAFILADATNTPARQFFGVSPLGYPYQNVKNANTGSQQFTGQISASDVGVGTFTAKSTWAQGPGTYQAAAWAYADTSGLPTNPAYANANHAENSLPGVINTAWFGATPNANIAGFCDATSYAPGATVNFKVDSLNGPFKVEVFRLGFYGYFSLGAQRVATVTGTPAVQAAPTVDAQGATICGSWTSTASWAIPATATPGVYLVNFRRTDVTTNVSQGVFIVRSTKPGVKQTKIMLMLSDTTWQAYNAWGATADVGTSPSGKSLYGAGPANLGTIANRANAVSFDRPYMPAAYTGMTLSWFLDAEISLINFLEGCGYAVDYYSSTDIENDSTIPAKYQLCIAAGHSEYWSLNMRNGFENARDAGTNLAFFSSNTSLWRVRWAVADTTFRRMICYKDTVAGANIDPGGWTGCWRDTGSGNPAIRPEARMTGLWFIANATVDTPMVVDYAHKNSPIWRNTTIPALAPAGTQSLIAHSLGAEVDYINAGDASMPAGIVALNTQSLTLTGTAARPAGYPYDQSGTFNVGLSMYRAASTGLVFNTGSWRWLTGLSRFRLSTFDSAGAIDAIIQQATVNVLGDLGVLPGGLLTNANQNGSTALVSPSPVASAAQYGLAGYVGWGLSIL